MNLREALESKDFDPDKYYVDTDLNVHEKNFTNRIWALGHKKKIDKVAVSEAIKNIGHLTPEQQKKLVELGKGFLESKNISEEDRMKIRSNFDAVLSSAELQKQKLWGYKERG